MGGLRLTLVVGFHEKGQKGMYGLFKTASSTFNIDVIPPYSSQTITPLVRSVLNCYTMQPLNVVSTYNDDDGLRHTQD